MAGMVGPSRSVQTKSLKPKVTVSRIFIKVPWNSEGHISLQLKVAPVLKNLQKSRTKKFLFDRWTKVG